MNLVQQRFCLHPAHNFLSTYATIVASSTRSDLGLGSMGRDGRSCSTMTAPSALDRIEQSHRQLHPLLLLQRSLHCHQLRRHRLHLVERRMDMSMMLSRVK